MSGVIEGSSGDSGLFLGAQSPVISGAWKAGRRNEVPGASTVVAVFSD